MSRPDPHSYTDLSQGRVQGMDLDLKVDFSKSVISGRAVYRLAAAVAGERADLKPPGAGDE